MIDGVYTFIHLPSNILSTFCVKLINNYHLNEAYEKRMIIVDRFDVADG
jgi:hypothetical protein